MESGLLYIAAVIVLVAVGFTFALVVSVFALREADRGWPQSAAQTAPSNEAVHTQTPALAPILDMVVVPAK
jgi:hypothetical protein